MNARIHPTEKRIRKDNPTNQSGLLTPMSMASRARRNSGALTGRKITNIAKPILRLQYICPVLARTNRCITKTDPSDRIDLVSKQSRADHSACSEVWLSPEVSNLISWVRIPAGAPDYASVRFIYGRAIDRLCEQGRSWVLPSCFYSCPSMVLCGEWDYQRLDLRFH